MRAERDDHISSPTVLIVEENPRVVETMMQMLDTSRYFFIFAEDSKNVVEEAKSHRPDCILMNLSLSLLDGNAIPPSQARKENLGPAYSIDAKNCILMENSAYPIVLLSLGLRVP